MLLSQASFAQTTKPLVSTDNNTQTCNTTRMIFPVGDLSCGGSVATVFGGSGGNTILNPNVGIGTISPTTTLQVAGNISLGTTSATLDYLTVNAGSTGGTTINATPSGQGGIDNNTLLAVNFSGTNGQNTYTAETGQTVTFNGTSALSTAQFIFPPSSLLTGTSASNSDYVSVPDQTNFHFGTGNFTIDFWVLFTTVPAGGCDLWASGSNAANSLSAAFTGTGGGSGSESGHQIQFFYILSNSIVFSFGFPFSPSPNVWYHIATVRNGNTYFGFVGGIGQTLSLYGGSYSQSLNQPSGNPWGIGTSNAGEYGGQPEYISNFRISNVARWTSNFTPPTGPWTSAYSTPTLTFANSGTIGAQINQSNNTGNLTLTNNSIPSIVISNNGNVGVGTLNVNGVPTSGTVLSGSAGQVPYYASAGTTLSGSSNILSNGTNVSIGTAIPQVSLHQYASSGFIGNTVQSGTSSFMGTSANSLTQPTIGYDSSHDLAFGTITSNAWAGFSEKMRITSVGNVGIGTWKPNRLLEVGSGIPSTIDTTNNRLVVLSTISSADTSGRTLSLSNFNSPFNGAGELFSYNYTSSVFDPLYISGSSIILGDSTRGAANVGIGTSSPANKFAVLGNVGIAATGGDSYLTTAAPSGGMIVEGNVGIGTPTPSARLSVFGGNVGIGRNTAEAALEVVDKNNSLLGGIVVSRSDSAGQYVGMSERGGSAHWIGATGSKTLYFTNADTSGFEFDVAASDVASGTRELFIGNGTVSTGHNTLDNGSGGISAATLTTSGNVGIGSTAPGQKLDVTGDIRGSGFSAAGTGEIVCVKANGSLGTCSIGVVGVTCTCS